MCFEKAFNDLIINLISNSWISTTQADKADKQCKDLLSNPDFISEAKKFDVFQDRVDYFCLKILISNSTIDLYTHGNARVEFGFSINIDILLPNMLSSSIVAQRIVYDTVSTIGGATNAEVNDMIKSVKASS